MLAARILFDLSRRATALAYGRVRVHLAPLVLTAIAVSLFLPGPWDASRAEAAKETQQSPRELTELRSAKSKTTREPDGRLKTTLSSQSLHYLDADDKWKDIDATFKTSSKVGAKWESGDNRFSVELADKAKDGFVTLRTQDGDFVLSLEGASDEATAVKAKDNTIVFKDALKDVDVEYVLLPDGLKESILLKKAGAPSEYRFRLEPEEGERWRTERRPGGVWFFHEQASEPAFVLPDPIVGDSLLLPSDGGKDAWTAAPGKASMEVEREDDGSFSVELRIDEGWLSSPDRIYPVVLDPTWLVQPDFQDGDYNTTTGGLPDTATLPLRTGRDGAGAPKYASVLSFDLGVLPPAARILEARLNLYLNACFPIPCSGGSHTGDVELRRLANGWPGTTWSNLTIDPPLLDKLSFTTTPTIGWKWWGSGALTQSVQSMVNGSLANYGFILEKKNGNDDTQYRFRSSRWSDPTFVPTMSIYWIADGVQVSPTLHTHANGAELTWQHFSGGTSAYADAVLDDNPVGYWRLDEAADIFAWDWSQQDNVGVVQDAAGAVRAEAGPLADYNLSTRFLGTQNGFLKVARDVSLQVNDTFTLETWLKRSDLTARDMAIFNDFGTGFWLRLNYANKIELLANGNGAPIAASTSTIQDTNWHHVAVTKAGATVKIYIDGVDVTGTVTNQTLTSSGLALHIGQTDGLEQPFFGWLDEAALYPSALSAARVQAHHAAAPIPMPGFLRFEIHRSATPGFTPSATTLIAKVSDVAIQTYRDTSAKASSTFYYEVVTVTAEGSFSSNEVRADLPAAGVAQLTVQPTYIHSSASGTHISSGSPDTEASSSGVLTVGSAGSNHTRALVAFELGAIPSLASGATVSSAQLKLYALGTTPAISAHRLSAMWWEAATTWNHREKASSLPWQTAGGDFDSGAAATSAGGSSLHWDTWTITSLVQDWLKGDKAQFGVLLKYASENGSQSTLTWASESYAGSAALRPTLVVTYPESAQVVSPTVAVSQPQAGESITGTVTVKAGALDDGRVTSVEFFLDGNPLGAPDTTAPYETSWNTVPATRGGHTLTAKAIDEAGNQTTSPGVAVTVANSASPATAITGATAGSGGTWTVNASASDDIGLSKVEFYVDGDRFASDSSSPWSATLDTLAFPAYDGSRTLTTKAYDADGNITTSANHPITVANTAGTTYKATITTSNVPLELRYEPAGSQEASPLTVSLTNTATQSWPTASIKLRYRWLSADSPPVAIDSGNVSIGADLGAGQQRNVSLSVDPPTLPGGVYRARYKLRIDLYDTAASAYFAAKGNAPYETWVTVTRKVLDELGLERYQQYDGEDLGGGFDHALNLANGNNVLQWVPFSQPGRGLNTVVTMTYNSLEHGSVSPLGNNWSLAISSLTPFGLPLDVHPNPADTAAGRTQKWVGFTDGDGSYHAFTGNAAGTYYTAPPGVHLYLKSVAGGWELWKPDRTKFIFDAAGFPTKVSDANGNELTFTPLGTPGPGEDAYGLAKRVTTITDAGGRTFNLSYFTKAETPTPAMRGKLKRLTDHVGHALEFTYYEDGNLRSIREKGGPGDDGMPTPDRELFLTYTTPNGSGPAIATFSARQNPEPATVQSPKLFSLIDFRLKETTFTYSTAANETKWRVSARTNRAGKQTTASYTAGIAPAKTTLTMPLSRVWEYTFDGEGRVTRLNDPVNAQDIIVEWADQTTPSEVANVVRKVTQPSGEFVEYAYNANGYKTDEWDELRNHQSFAYQNIAIDGNDISGNWPAGRSIPHLSQLTSLVKPVGNATTADPSDYRWTFAYTTTGLVDTITDPKGSITDNAWNANGTLASQTLPNNNDGITRTTTFDSYDQNGLVTQMTDAAGGITRAGYAANGNLLWLQDPQHAGNSGTPASEYRTEHFYDAHGRAVSSSQPKSTASARGLLVWEGQTYDAGDNVVSEIGPHYGRGDGRNGALHTTTFDDMGRPLLATGPRPAADGGPVKAKTEYDDAGRVSKFTKPRGVDSAPANDYATETAYDLLDREKTITVHALDPANNRITNHCYDDAGDLRSITGPKGAASFTSCPDPAANPYVYTTASHTSKFEYDKAHRQLKTTNAAGHTSQASYDENGQVKTETDELGKVTSVQYEERGLKAKTIEPFDTGRTLTTISEYDQLGNLKRLISPRAFDAAGGQAPFTDYVESYSYDALERLTKTTLPVGQGANAYFGTVLADGPLAYWRFGSGGTDETSPPSDATIYGGSLGQPGALAGDPDGSMSCNGTAMCAYVSEENETNPYWSLSIEAWVKTSSTAEQTIFAHNDHGVRLWAQGGGFHFKWTTDINRNGWTVGTPGGYADGAWHHVVAVFENWTGTIRIYVDGTEKGAFSQGGAGSVYYSTSAASIGGDWGNGSNFTGSLDELAFYGSALTAGQVGTHYAARVHQPLPQAYRHQAYNMNGDTTWTSLPTLASTPGAVTEQEKTSLTYWDTGSIYSSQDPAKPKVRFDYTAEGWQSSRIPEYTWVSGWLDFSQQMAWDYLPDGLQRGLRDEGEGRALYSYDQNGNRTQAKEASGLVSPGQEPLPIDLSYNGFDELSKVRSPKPGASGTYLATTLAYDPHGNTIQLVDNREENSSGSQTAAGRGHIYTYNAIDQPTTQTDDFATTASSDDEQLTYTYKSTGALDTQTLKKNPSGSWVDEQSSVRTYFENGLLKTLTNRNGAGALIEEHTLSYIKDGVYLNGNRVSDSFYLKGPDSSPTVPCYWNACTATWAYDARERVTIENPGTGQTRAFALDVQGNVTQESAGNSTIRTYSGQQLQTQTQGGVLTRFLYDALGSLDCQVKSAHTGTTCPASGNTNLIEDNAYDYKARLIGYRYYNGVSTASKRIDYTNDPLDRPVKQVETISGTTTTYDFTYIGVTNALSKEVLSGGTSATKKYAYDAFGNRATISEDKPGDSTKRYSYLYDPHSSVSLLIDQSNVVKESYGYQAYGAANAALTRTASGFDSKTNPYRYTGKRLDSGSGTYDMGARRYSASTGRFLQYDVFADALDNFELAENPLTQNRYALAGGNPVNFVEVDGHQSWRDWANAHRKFANAVGSAAKKAHKALDTGARVGARFVVGATTPKGLGFLALSVTSAGISIAFGVVGVISTRHCVAAARVIGGIEGAALIAHGCAFVAGTLAQGAAIFAALSLYLSYLVYKEGEKVLDGDDEEGRPPNTDHSHSPNGEKPDKPSSGRGGGGGWKVL